MKYKYLTVTLLSLLLFSTNSKSEIIDIQKETKQFGEWQVLCETDVMMATSDCKIASKFYNNTSVISIDPSSKLYNQIILVIPQIKVGSFLKLRIDQYDLIFSNSVKESDFGLIPLNKEQKSLLLKQMKKGDFLFIRFNIRDSKKEITAKINLKDFRQSIDYYNNRII